MLVEACYRLTYHGEVIHTKYDTKEEKIIGLPEEFFDVKDFGLKDYSYTSYLQCERELDKYVESILLSFEENAIAIEFINLGAFTFTFDGRYTRVNTGMEYGLDGFKLSQCLRPNIKNFVNVGFRTTKLMQLRAADKIYQLTYNIKDNVFHTNDGILIPEFDVKSLDPIDFNYRGYKDCVNGGHYAVVYQGGVPRFLDKTPDNKLIIV